MPGGRADVLALVTRMDGRSLSDAGRDTVSEWDAFSGQSFRGTRGVPAVLGVLGVLGVLMRVDEFVRP
jgi:hypothetical protein